MCPPDVCRVGADVSCPLRARVSPPCCPPTRGFHSTMGQRGPVPLLGAPWQMCHHGEALPDCPLVGGTTPFLCHHCCQAGRQCLTMVAQPVWSSQQPSCTRSHPLSHGARKGRGGEACIHASSLPNGLCCHTVCRGRGGRQAGRGSWAPCSATVSCKQHLEVVCCWEGQGAVVWEWGAMLRQCGHDEEKVGKYCPRELIIPKKEVGGWKQRFGQVL